MDVDRLCLLFCIFYQSVFILGILIDPRRSDSSSTVHVHCLASGNVIQIKDPFQKSQFDDSQVLAIVWYQYSDNGTKEVQLLEFLKDKPGQNTFLPKFSVFESFGLQINSVDLGDSAVYKAKLVTLAESDEKTIQIEVASPPVLESERLSLTQSVNGIDGSVTLSCGRVANLGAPPVRIVLKAANGTVLPAVYRGGVLTLIVTAKEADSGRFTCEMDMSDPAARCIESKDVPRWQGAVTDTSKTNEAGSDIIGIIAGTVAAVVVVVIVVVIVIIVLKRRGTKTYNANDGERRSGENKLIPLVRDDGILYDRPSVSRGPIYKGHIEPSPYMVSRISQGNGDSMFNDTDQDEYEEIGHGNGGRSPPPPNSGKFNKRADDKRKTEKERSKEISNDREGTKAKPGKDGQKLPRAKPRSIFLTPSMEELDKISKAVAGGEGSGAGGEGRVAGGLGTQV